MAVNSSITVMPPEKGTAKVTVTFSDETGASVAPSAVTWTLTDRAGNVINDRLDVAVTPGATVTFALYGNDLAITGNDAQRVLLIEATYNSSLGSNLPLKAQAFFTVAELVGVS
jgi:hypothetical protein